MKLTSLLLVGLMSGVFLLGACSSMKQSSPSRTASEQLLISQAADSAAEQLLLKLQPDRIAYLDTANFEGTDSKYAVSAIKVALMRQGIHFVDDKTKADTIIEIRSGALSIDQSETVVGTPATNLSVINVPEVSVFKSQLNEGVAKFAAFAYDAKSGELLTSAGPVYGFSRRLDNQALSSITWGTREGIYGVPQENGELVPGLPTTTPTVTTTKIKAPEKKSGPVSLSRPGASTGSGSKTNPDAGDESETNPGDTSVWMP